jgi:DNA-binding response OmpR family regulator
MHPSILIVEDDVDDVSFLQEGFNEINFHNVVFYNEALSAIKYLNSIEDDQLPDLIVTDFNLPALNGLELVRFLKRHVRFSGVPVVVFSTSISAADRHNFINEGVADILIKPAVYDEFKSISRIFKNIVVPT